MLQQQEPIETTPFPKAEQPAQQILTESQKALQNFFQYSTINPIIQLARTTDDEESHPGDSHDKNTVRIHTLRITSGDDTPPNTGQSSHEEEDSGNNASVGAGIKWSF